MPGMTLWVVQVAKTLSQLVFVSSIAISQHDQIADLRPPDQNPVKHRKYPP